jgi:hypothetical protein
MGENYTHHSKNTSGHLAFIHLSIMTLIICIDNAIDCGHSHHTLSYMHYQVERLIFGSGSGRLFPLQLFMGLLHREGKLQACCQKLESRSFQQLTLIIPVSTARIMKSSALLEAPEVVCCFSAGIQGGGS